MTRRIRPRIGRRGLPRVHRAGPAKSGSEAITVVVGGSTRQVTAITAKDEKYYIPGSNQLRMINQLPGVTFQSADPLGMAEWGQSLFARGFGQNQLGFTLDDLPLGDMSYNNYNGLNIGRAVISENIARVNVWQGAGAVDVASSSDIGGAIQFTSVAPTERAGGTIARTFGIHGTYRTFARANTGAFNPSGTRMMLAYAHSQAQKWNGAGARTIRIRSTRKSFSPSEAMSS